jgi:hypothetical protein
VLGAVSGRKGLHYEPIAMSTRAAQPFKAASRAVEFYHCTNGAASAPHDVDADSGRKGDRLF